MIGGFLPESAAQLLNPAYVPAPMAYVVLGIITLCLFASAVYDSRHFVIPDLFVLAGFLCACVAELFAFFWGWSPTWGETIVRTATLLTVTILMYLFWRLYEDKLGLGDVTLLIFVAVFVPVPLWIVFVSAGCLLGLPAFAFAYLLQRKTVTHEAPFLPFAPILLAGWLASMALLIVYGRL